MSGIVGIVQLDGAPVDRELLERMTGSLAARGPDAQQTWGRGGVGFGHTLLRTTWESSGESQPLTLDGQTWIVADCRVDARDELLRALADRGCAAETDAPDPELILRAYTVWGEACLDRLLGDFSFAIWDEGHRTLVCARDHFGVKPFFYVHVDRTFIFSNDLNCLRLHPSVPTSSMRWRSRRRRHPGGSGWVRLHLVLEHGDSGRRWRRTREGAVPPVPAHERSDLEGLDAEV